MEKQVNIADAGHGGGEKMCMPFQPEKNMEKQVNIADAGQGVTEKMYMLHGKKKIEQSKYKAITSAGQIK
ncbi:MAG: hypothetical protein PHS82_14630 [Lachnospiraceae bacterium]|nr:hypothetical protein [Lachnospiraceae bacterium]